MADPKVLAPYGYTANFLPREKPRRGNLADKLCQGLLEGETHKQIAERLGCHINSLYACIREPRVQAVLETVRHRRAEELEQKRHEAKARALETFVAAIADAEDLSVNGVATHDGIGGDEVRAKMVAARLGVAKELLANEAKGGGAPTVQVNVGGSVDGGRALEILYERTQRAIVAARDGGSSGKSQIGSGVGAGGESAGGGDAGAIEAHGDVSEVSESESAGD